MSNGLGQSDFQWGLRTNPKIREIWEKLYQTCCHNYATYEYLHTQNDHISKHICRISKSGHVLEMYYHQL